MPHPDKLQSPPIPNPAANLPERDPEKIRDSTYGLVPTACQYCVVGCGYEAHVWNAGHGSNAASQLEQAHWVSPAMTGLARYSGVEKAIAVTPDPKCSMNKGNHSPRGGTQGRNLVHSPQDATQEQDSTRERITTPYVRTATGWKPIATTAAREILAELVKAATGWENKNGQVRFRKPGGLGVKLYEYQYLENTFAATKLFYQLIGTPNVAFHDRPSTASNTQGFDDSGLDPHGYAYDDFWDSDVIFIAGNNPYESQSVFFMQYMAGKKLVVLDPRRTITVDYAEKTGGLHLQPTVLGADTLVLNALARFLRDRQGWTRDENGHWNPPGQPDDWPVRVPIDMIARHNIVGAELAKERADATQALDDEGPRKKRRAEYRLSLDEYFDFLDRPVIDPRDSSSQPLSLSLAAELSGIPEQKLTEAAQLLGGPSTGIADRLPAPNARRVCLIFEKGLIWGFSYQNTAAMANLGLLLGSVLRPGAQSGEDGVNVVGVTGRAGGHQKGWAEINYKVAHSATGKEWDAGYPFHNARDEFGDRSPQGQFIKRFRTHHYFDAHLVGTTVAKRHPRSSPVIRKPEITLLWVIGSNAVGQIGNAQAKVAKLQQRRGTSLPVSESVTDVLAVFKERIRKGQLVVVQQEIYPNPTTEIADLVLPAAGWGEEDFSRYTGERRLRLYGRFQDPPAYRDPATGQLETDTVGQPVSRCLSDWRYFQHVAQSLLPSGAEGNGLPNGFVGQKLKAADFAWTKSADVFWEMANFSNRKNLLKVLEVGPQTDPRGHELLRSQGTEGYVLPLTLNGKSLVEHRRVPVSQDRPYAFVRPDWNEIADDFQAIQVRPRDELFLCNGRVNELWNSMFTHIRNETIRQRWPDDMPGTLIEIHPDDARDIKDQKGKLIRDANGQVIGVRNGDVIEVTCARIHLGAAKGRLRAVVAIQPNSVPRGMVFAIFSYPVNRRLAAGSGFPFRDFSMIGYVNNGSTGYVDPINPIAAVKYARGKIRFTGEHYSAAADLLGPSYAPRNVAFVANQVTSEIERADWKMRELIVQKGLPRATLKIETSDGGVIGHEAYTEQFRRPDEFLLRLKAGPAIFLSRLGSMMWNPDHGAADNWSEPYLSFAMGWAASAHGALTPEQRMLGLIRAKQPRAKRTHDWAPVPPNSNLQQLFIQDDPQQILQFLKTGTLFGDPIIIPGDPDHGALIDNLGSMPFTPAEVSIVKDWISSLAPVPPLPPLPPPGGGGIPIPPPISITTAAARTVANTDLARISKLRIHPSIGIARLGNAGFVNGACSLPADPQDYFIGPERPYEVEPPAGGYKRNGFVRRQAARFRIFAYDQTDQLLGELTATQADIQWTVELANKKAAWNEFAGLNANTELRNSTPPAAAMDRTKLIIGPQLANLLGPNQAQALNNCEFTAWHNNVPRTITGIYLGQAETDADGRLLVLGGQGRSETPWPGIYDLPDYANNDGWFDDVSDGPVRASVTIRATQQQLDALGSWVICAPPKFAPALRNLVTLYDTLFQVAVDNGWLQVPPQPSFVNDIYPILERTLQFKWIMGITNAANRHQAKLAAAFPPAANQQARDGVFRRLRNPSGQTSPQQNMPHLFGDSGSASRMAITKAQYEMLQKWRDGQFDSTGWNPQAPAGPQPPTEITPQGLDQAALENCAGAAFFPGIEASWFVRDTFAYVEPFRPDILQLTAGDISKQMALPWQADFYDCSADETARYPGWWPQQRPDFVHVNNLPNTQLWVRQKVGSHEDMVQFWHELGFVVWDANQQQFLEIDRNP